MGFLSSVMPLFDDATSTLTTILSDTGDVVESALGWVGDVLDVITGSPVLMLFAVSVPLVGLGVGLLSRIMRA